MSELSWKPILQGSIYCSPACGRKCTKAEYDRAGAQAEKAKAKMREPDKWKVDVWENMGWYSRLTCLGLTVDIDEKENYTCMLSVDGSPGGSTFWTQHPCPRFKDPQAAADDAIKFAQTFIDQCQACVDKVKGLG